jgi:hypothetical protein
MTKDTFARTFGFEDYGHLLASTTTVFKDNDTDTCWNITKLSQDRFLTWDDAEIGDDRVEVFLTENEAQAYLKRLQDRHYGQMMSRS